MYSAFGLPAEATCVSNDHPLAKAFNGLPTTKCLTTTLLIETVDSKSITLIDKLMSQCYKTASMQCR